jgi:hypothetical protein
MKNPDIFASEADMKVKFSGMVDLDPLVNFGEKIF